MEWFYLICQEGKYDEYKKAKKSIPDDMWETVSSFAETVKSFV